MCDVHHAPIRKYPLQIQVKLVEWVSYVIVNQEKTPSKRAIDIHENTMQLRLKPLIRSARHWAPRLCIGHLFEM